MPDKHDALTDPHLKPKDETDMETTMPIPNVRDELRNLRIDIGVVIVGCLIALSSITYADYSGSGYWPVALLFGTGLISALIYYARQAGRLHRDASGRGWKSH